MAFCLPWAQSGGTTPDGGLIVEVGALCWGQDIPAPNLPAQDFPVPDTNLPAHDLARDGSGTISGADVEDATKADTQEEPCETCPKCVARDMGAVVPHVFGNVPPASKRGYDYQHFICPWHSYVSSANMIEEWNFSGVDFDGLHPAECHLYEAKHGYDGFLEQDDWSSGGRPELQDWATNAFTKMLEQAERQRDAVLPHYPDVRLTWVFSNMMTRLYLYDIFLDGGLAPPIAVEVRPFR